MAINGRRGPTVIQFPRLGRWRLPQGNWLGWAAVALAALVLIFSAAYTVQPEEAGVVQRFGEFVRQTGPGFHLKLPFGIERVTKVPVQRQLKQEFGFHTERVGVRSEYGRTEEELAAAHMLTGDLNAAVVEWVVQYRVVDPMRFLFRVRNVEDTLRDISEAVMRRVVGDRTVSEVLTVGRQEISVLAEQELQALCDQYQTGLRIEQVVLQDVNPPDAVKDSFNEVNRAQQERERLINEAEAQYNRLVPRAEGEAQKTIESAEGYAVQRVNRATGEAARFTALLAEYERAPEVTRRRLYLETMAEILPKVGRKVVVDEAVEGLLPLLDLTPQLRRTEPPQAGGDSP
ncbi:MAG: FtsH protease activity modulator HflK [Thermoanaerobaculia bacterium]